MREFFFSFVLLALTPALSPEGRGSLQAAEIECVSMNVSSGSIGERTNYRPRISADGRFVVFESRDQSIAQHRSKFRDIFFYDRNKRVTKKIEPMMERSNSGPMMGDGGRYMAYQSYPLSVILGTPPLTADIFVYDRYLNKSSLQTFGEGAKTLDGENRDPSFSSDGRYLVFTSNASIYPGLKNGITRQVYIFDHDARALELVSRAWTDQSMPGDPGNRPSGDPRVGRNGRFVAFKSASTNLMRLLPLDSLSTHLYLLDRKHRIMIQVDQPERGFDSDHLTVGRYDMDNNGMVMVFEGRPRNLEKPLEPLSTTDLYVFNRSSGTVELLTTDLFSHRSHSPSLSGDGRFMAFIFRGISKGDKVAPGLIIYDMKADRWTKIASGSMANPSFSRNGEFIAFESDEPDLVPGIKSRYLQIYVVRNPYYEEPEQ